MKVLFSNKFFYFDGGAETVFFQERNFLKGNGVEVVDFSMQDERNLASDFTEYFVPHVDYKKEASLFTKLRNAARFIRSGEAMKRLAALVDKESPQIAHLHNIYHQLTPSIIPLLKQKGVKVILTLHDGKLICPAYLMVNKGRICIECKGKRFYKAAITKCQGSLSKGLLLAAEAYWHKWCGSYEQVDLFITPSTFLADVIGQCHIPKDHIRVLRNGIDTNAFLPGEKDEGYALYFGRLTKEKGIQTLLLAHNALAKRMPLKVVGTGLLEGEFRTRYTDVEFMGYRSGEVLRSIVRNASFVVVPSECYENCSMVVLEAMALGKPVIGSRIGGIPEQIEDGITGFLFEMGNVSELAEKMQKLNGDVALRRSMGAAARSKLEREYSLNMHLNELMEIYKKISNGEK